MYKLFSRYGYFTSGDYRCCVVAVIMIRDALRLDEYIDVNPFGLSIFKTSICIRGKLAACR